MHKILARVHGGANSDTLLKIPHGTDLLLEECCNLSPSITSDSGFLLVHSLKDNRSWLKYLIATSM